jgi:hypothetical protein
MPTHRRTEADIHAEFLSSWDWPRFLAAWREAVGELPEPLALQIPLAAPQPVRGTLFVDPCHIWWPAGLIVAKQRRLQLQLFHSSRVLMDDGFRQRVSERITAELLSQASSPDERDALLIAAAIHRYKNSRIHRTPYHLSYRVLLTITKWALAATSLDHFPWHHMSIQALPGNSGAFDDDSDDEEIEPWNGFLLSRALGLYHRDLLSSWRPVTLVIDAHGDPALVEACREELAREAAAQQAAEQAREDARRAQQARDDAWRGQQEAERDAEARRWAEHLQLHPRALEWPPAAAVLRELVWSMPTIEVGDLFGVSDVAIGKLCTRLNVPKPPRGFWRKVETGQLKHPRGRVPKDLRERNQA